MSKQWHVQQSTAEQLYEQTPDETVQLIWTDPPFGTDQLQVGSEHSYRDGTVADTLALTDQLGAVEAVQGAIPGINVLTAERALTAAAPHIRADERRRVAEEIRARIDSAEDEHPFVEGVNAGFEYAARIAEGGAE